METEQIALITEQLGRLADKIGARLEAVEVALKAHETLETERSTHIRAKLDDLQKDADDHESRLRQVQDQTTRNQVVLGLSSGGAVLASIIATLRAFVGP